MRSSFLRFKGNFTRGRLNPGESAAHRSSHPEKSRNAGEATLPEGEPRDGTATPAKPSLTGGAGPRTYLSSGEGIEQAGISSPDENYLAIPLI